MKANASFLTGLAVDTHSTSGKHLISILTKG